MKTMLVGYDLNRPGQNYGDLIDRLKEFPGWWHHLDSTWIVKTDKTHVQVRDELKQHLLDSNDELLVVDITGDAAAWCGFSDRASTWLKSNL